MFHNVEFWDLNQRLIFDLNDTFEFENVFEQEIDEAYSRLVLDLFVSAVDFTIDSFSFYFFWRFFFIESFNHFFASFSAEWITQWDVWSICLLLA